MLFLGTKLELVEYFPSPDYYQKVLRLENIYISELYLINLKNDSILDIFRNEEFFKKSLLYYLSVDQYNFLHDIFYKITDKVDWEQWPDKKKTLDFLNDHIPF